MVWGLATRGLAVGCAASAQTLAQPGLQSNGITNERKGKIMKERQDSTRWLGLALAGGFLTFAASSEAAKPPKPPPTPSGPAYRIVALGRLGVDTLAASAVNNAGSVVGGGYKAIGDSLVSVVGIVVPEASADGPVYFRDTSPADGVNDLMYELPGLPAALGSGASDINDAGWVCGSCTLGTVDEPYDTAAIWAGNTPIDLGCGEAYMTYGYEINNLGLAVTGPDLWVLPSAPCYVAVPKDNDGDRVPDTWFEDLNGDGANDLLKLLTTQFGWYDAFAPEGGINDAGQVILNWNKGSDFLLSPDSTDADGDGNPWYADTNGDGFNDLMVQLVGLAGADAYAADINNAGQVVGASNGRAVRWDFTAAGTQTITDLGSLSKTMPNTSAGGINDAGQIVGTAWGQNKSTPFLFQNGKMYDLATLLVNGTGWTGLAAGDINNQGIIIGNGYLNGTWQGFVAIPVTQP